MLRLFISNPSNKGKTFSNFSLEQGKNSKCNSNILKQHSKNFIKIYYAFSKDNEKVNQLFMIG